MTQTDPIQAQLIAARRNQILDAATKVFAEKGFHRTTIKDIAREASIADGTIYNYFENKTALLLGILNRLNETDQRNEDFTQAVQGDIREWTRTYVQQRFALFSPEVKQVLRALLPEMLVNRELGELYMKEIVGPTFVMAQQHFDQWIEQGLIKPFDPALALRVVAGTFFGLLVLSMLGDPELESRWNELPELLSEFILSGIAKGDHNE